MARHGVDMMSISNGTYMCNCFALGDLLFCLLDSQRTSTC
jgi:hypothetical protein